MGLNLPSDHRTTSTQDSSHDGKHRRQIQLLGDLFLLLGTSPAQNIDAIVRQTSSVLDCPCALYSRIDNEAAFLTCRAGYNLPPGFPTRIAAKGRICYEATIKGCNQPIVLSDISQTPYQLCDPHVRQYNFKAYLGFPVTSNHEIIGALAVLDTRVRQFDETDIYLISALAQASARIDVLLIFSDRSV